MIPTSSPANVEGSEVEGRDTLRRKESKGLQMSRIARALLCLALVIGCTVEVAATGNEFGWKSKPPEAVEFDVPAVCPARLVLPEPSRNQDDKSKVLRPVLHTGGEALVELVVPVTTRVKDSKKCRMSQFRFEIFWNRNVYPLVDYGPRTITGSSIEGLVSVEKREEKNASLGLNLNGQFNNLINASVNGNLQNKNGILRRYEEVPEHEIFVASGTIQRGTGAFFRFHPNRIATLEGGRDLMVAYRVPHSWRGGLIQVDCHGEGKRKYFAGLSESIESQRSFVMPVFLDGDVEAREIAFAYVRAEQDLRRGLNGLRIGSQPLDVSGLVMESGNERLKQLRTRHSLISVSQRKTIDAYLAAKQMLTALSLE